MLEGKRVTTSVGHLLGIEPFEQDCVVSRFIGFDPETHLVQWWALEGGRRTVHAHSIRAISGDRVESYPVRPIAQADIEERLLAKARARQPEPEPEPAGRKVKKRTKARPGLSADAAAKRERMLKAISPSPGPARKIEPFDDEKPRRIVRRRK